MFVSFLGVFLSSFFCVGGTVRTVAPEEQDFKKRSVCFVACHAGPASHFAVYAEELAKRGYSVEVKATGPALKKLQGSFSFKVEPFFLEEGKEKQEAEKIAKVCKKASMVISDVGHVFDSTLQKALRKFSPEVRRIAYYDNPEAYVPGGYSEMASKVIEQAEKVIFANRFLAKEPIYQTPCKEIELAYENRVGLGYYPIGEAQEILRKREKEQGELRKRFFKKANIEDKGQKTLVYIGGNNEVYFSRALPSFFEFITGLSKQKDLSSTLVVLQQHPGAKEENRDALYMENWVKEEETNPFFPKCIISGSKTEEVLALADAVFYYQTSMAPQFVLAGIPAVQIGDTSYEDILVKNGLCWVVNSTKDLVQTYDALQENRESKCDVEGIKQKLGMDPFWAVQLEELIQKKE